MNDDNKRRKVMICDPRNNQRNVPPSDLECSKVRMMVVFASALAMFSTVSWSA